MIDINFLKAISDEIVNFIFSVIGFLKLPKKKARIKLAWKILTGEPGHFELTFPFKEVPGEFANNVPCDNQEIWKICKSNKPAKHAFYHVPN